MNKMDRHAIRSTSDGRSQACDVTKVYSMRGVVSFCFCPLAEKLVNTSCFFFFCLFLRCKHQDPINTMMLKIYCKLLVKKLKFSTLVAKSDLRFKVH